MQPPGGGFQRITLPGVKYLVAVTSGKGGVGKSTVATNLALALHMQGRRVGLMDADIYGPSIPIMMGVPKVDPQTTPFPVDRFGIKLMSMGFLVDANQAAILRGPMIHKYMTAFLTQIAWGELDFLIVDMPPGTGDAQLSLAQTAPLSGVVTVVTPQDVSLTVASRGIQMFRTVKVPILGIVENMSYFTGDDGKRYEIFRHGGGQKLAQNAGVPFLGEIPIDPRVAECSDAGEPLVHKYPDSAVAKAYLTLASRVVEELQKMPASPELPGLKL
jgi:ATP-binding protein involved in chromosome partitioning